MSCNSPISSTRGESPFTQNFINVNSMLNPPAVTREASLEDSDNVPYSPPEATPVNLTNISHDQKSSNISAPASKHREPNEECPKDSVEEKLTVTLSQGDSITFTLKPSNDCSLYKDGGPEILIQLEACGCHMDERVPYHLSTTSRNETRHGGAQLEITWCPRP